MMRKMPAIFSSVGSSEAIRPPANPTEAPITVKMTPKPLTKAKECDIVSRRLATASGELLTPVILEKEPAGTCLERTVDILVEVEGCDYHHGHGIVDSRAGELSGRFESVHVGHANVEEADVGAQVTGERDRLASVRCLADHLDVGLGLQDRLEARPDEALIIGN